jgi:hypothetical protein
LSTDQDPPGAIRADLSVCQKSTGLSKKPPQYPVGATIGRPAILEQNCIAKCDYFLFSSKTATIASQLLRGRRIAAPTVSNEADGFLIVCALRRNSQGIFYFAISRNAFTA